MNKINRKLGLIAGYGAVICIGTGIYFKSKINDKFRETDYYKNSLKLLRGHRGASYLMGEPIRSGKIDLGDEKSNFVDGIIARLAIPVNGPKQNGVLYVYASRPEKKGQYTINNLELQLQNEPNRRLVIFKEETEKIDVIHHRQ